MKLTETLKRRIDAFFRNLNDEELEYLNEKYFNKPKEAINYTRCCTEFFCEDEDLEYSSKKCNEQCIGCKWIENL